MLGADARLEIILQAAGEVECSLGRYLGLAEKGRIAGPPDLHPTEQIGLGPRHGEQACRIECRSLAEDLAVRAEPYARTATVLHLADLLERACCDPARIALPIEPTVACDLHFQDIGQSIDDRYADAVQAAGGFIDLGVELAAGMQRGHDDLESRLVLVFGMRVHRNAAPVIGDRQETLRVKRDLDEGGMAGHRLVHRIVDDFGEQVVERLGIRTAHIHSRAPADGLQPLQHLDIGRGIVVVGRGLRSTLRRARLLRRGVGHRDDARG